MKFSLVTINVTDMNACVDFFQNLIGMKLQKRYPIPVGELAFLGEEDQPQIELVASSHNPGKGFAGFSVGFETQDMEASIQKFEAAGYPLQRRHDPKPMVSLAFFHGPEGIEVELVHYKKA